MQSTIMIGTSGYSYGDWVGTVYPSGCSPRDFLSLYARSFSCTELNFTYYRYPEPRTMERMLRVVGDDFRFAVKGHQSLTHQPDADCAETARRFREGIAPLIEAGQLTAVLLQFPFSFHYTAPNRTRLDALCRAFDTIPLALEFRNNEWQRDSVIGGLTQRGVALVNVDGPLLPGLPRPTSLVTAPLGYVRFHGRNAANWWSGDTASRYDYLYTEDDLSPWVSRIGSMAAGASRGVMVMFNNHWRGQAVQNACQLSTLLGGVVAKGTARQGEAV